jgi:hypothetical protein
MTDKQYCPYYLLCKSGWKCKKALTGQVIRDAKKQGKDSILSYDKFPPCFVRMWEVEGE